MAKNFKTGDVVYLKSGGPDMTVRDYKKNVGSDLKHHESDTDVTCEWFDGAELKSDVFHQDSLAKLENN